MFRRSIATLLSSVTLVAVSLSISDPAHAATSFTYYAGGQQTVTDSMMQANFGVARPVLNDPETRSAAMMVAKNTAGDAVGIGWTVDPALNDDSEPHLTVAWWKNGAGQCYNDECAGYTALAGAAFTIGQKLTPGTVQRLGVQYFEGAWWLWASISGGAGGWIGYYADTNWTSPWPVFNRVQLYGELTTTALEPTSQMGNGNCSDLQTALSINSVSFTTSAAVNLKSFATYPRAYSVFPLSARTFRYGGAGMC